MTEDLLVTVILQAPNVAVALFVVWWQGRHIDKLADSHRAQTDVMLELIGRVIAAETRAEKLNLEINGGTDIQS